MANTIIQLKKSGISGNVPSSLSYGELALNYNDGKLYYKNANNIITYISSGSQTNSFATVNANSSLILATSNTDTLSIAAGNNISISACTVNKTITISSTGGLSSANLQTVTASGNTTNNSITVGGLKVGALTFPNTDGAASQVLTTNGSGTLSWSTVSSGTSSNAVTQYVVTTDSFTGDGSTAQFQLSSTPTDKNYTTVIINGVTQSNSTYSVTNSTLTFNTAPDNFDNIEIKVIGGTTATAILRNYTKFIYNITTPTSVITGADSRGLVLAYDSNAVDVYLNGIRLVQGDDYTVNGGTSITLNTTAINTDTVEILSYGKAFLNDGVIPVSATFAAATANQVFDAISTSQYTSAKYFFQIKYSSQIHVSEVMIMTDGTTSYIQEYGIMAPTGMLGTFNTDISAGTMRLLFSPANANTSIKAKRVTITV